MMMMAMPARIPSWGEKRSTSAPIALALAPKATNTVEKPATNNTDASSVSRHTSGCGSASARRSSDVPAR